MLSSSISSSIFSSSMLSSSISSSIFSSSMLSSSSSSSSFSSSSFSSSSSSSSSSKYDISVPFLLLFSLLSISSSLNEYTEDSVTLDSISNNERELLNLKLLSKNIYSIIIYYILLINYINI